METKKPIPVLQSEINKIVPQTISVSHPDLAKIPSKLNKEECKYEISIRIIINSGF